MHYLSPYYFQHILYLINLHDLNCLLSVIIILLTESKISNTAEENHKSVKMPLFTYVLTDDTMSF